MNNCRHQTSVMKASAMAVLLQLSLQRCLRMLSSVSHTNTSPRLKRGEAHCMIRTWVEHTTTSRIKQRHSTYRAQTKMSGNLLTDLSGHLALVTGATGGIGSATVIALASLGCNIAVHYNSNADKAKSLISQLNEKGIQAKSFQADLSSYDETRRLHKEVVEAMGPPTILYNNAGLTAGKSGIKDISEVSIEDFEYTWRANCGTQYLLTQLCIPDMVAKEFGRVIFCSSVAGLTGGVVGPHYA